MSVALSATPPGLMTVREFLDWCPDDGQRWQLVDGVPVAMAPPNRTHGAIRNELGRLLSNHLAERGSPCSVVVTPGVVPQVYSARNMRVPDLAVTCTDDAEEEDALTDPVLVVEILSPRNHADTWRNVWAYTTVPSVREILVVRSAEVRAHPLRRQPDGNWPASPLPIGAEENLVLDSVGGFRAPLRAPYRTTRLRDADARA